ncbi:STN domain-containing protein [Psychrosphaera algicola]|uniref:TonB-dependent receptor n=1 Tax=Psychrosphaera algicola TaxID=3023714 RepID=A0ABT5FB76_9GAMM|nr:TonB-dependent receptor [Psychrosphaera sp. G1-22]MDC2888790.1 TonB-dependent receptor [Psychrosphaera sp. G1-22]
MTFSIQTQAIFLVCAVLYSQVSVAEDVQPKSSINIPASNLVDALNSFAKQTNRALIYPYHLASSLYVDGLQGEFSASQALQQLLKDTPLKGTVRPSGVIQITKIQPVVVEEKAPVVLKGEVEISPVVEEIEVIVVEGKMFAMDKSANFKRFSDSQTEQISQSQINQIAKNNAADVVRNVPSISTDKIYGGGTHVSVRGLEQNLITSFIMAVLSRRKIKDVSLVLMCFPQMLSNGSMYINLRQPT